MCGIVGVCEPGLGAQVDREALARATDRLRHRGPDGSGLYLRDNVGLGHRRLSIIDLAGGDQPMFNEDRTIAIVFNGEIYNYRELRRELEGRGHGSPRAPTPRRSFTPTRSGAECLRRFKGMFAFAIWDERDRRLFIARDRLGKKPLFYHAADGRLVFASEMKALLRAPGGPEEVDQARSTTTSPTATSRATAASSPAWPSCPPAHWMRWKDGRLRGRAVLAGRPPARPGADARRSGPSAWRWSCGVRCACAFAPTCRSASS